VGIVSSWYPINNLTEKPEPNVTNKLLCCNQQRKAYQRTLPTNTNISKKYYQTSYMYLYNRCQTFKQRQFNFVNGPTDKNLLKLFLTYPFVTAKILQYTKPGDPLSIVNYYVAQCNPNFTVETAVEIGFINSLSKDDVLVILSVCDIPIPQFVDITPSDILFCNSVISISKI
jgi:hypothetical protein